MLCNITPISINKCWNFLHTMSIVLIERQVLDIAQKRKYLVNELLSLGLSIDEIDNNNKSTKKELNKLVESIKRRFYQEYRMAYSSP